MLGEKLTKSDHPLAASHLLVEWPKFQNCVHTAAVLGRERSCRGYLSALQHSALRRAPGVGTRCVPGALARV